MLSEGEQNSDNSHHDANQQEKVIDTFIVELPLFCAAV